MPGPTSSHWALPLLAISALLLRSQQGHAALVKHDLRVSLLRGAPDCYPKTLIVANNQFQYPIEVTQGDTLEVNVYNDLPEDYPMVLHGFSIHFHGFAFRGDQPYGPGSGSWFDGVSFVTQCPIPAGGNMTSVMTVNESPGSYWWHGHGGVEAVDGLYGPLIVRPKAAEPLQYDDEIILMVGDWFHDQAAQMAMRLNRPFDKNVTKEDPDKGGWVWTDLPQAMHFNGHGYFGDCPVHSAPSGTAAPITCNPVHFAVPAGRSAIMPWATFDNPGCTHWNTTVEQGKTYRVRITNVASLGYVTVVFQGHNVTLVAADGSPLEPKEVSQVDVNNGMRYDVLLKADQPIDNYWIFVQMQYRVGSPAGYAVLRYKGAKYNDTDPPLPESAPPQPDTFAPWPIAYTSETVQGLKELYDTTDGPANQTALEIYGIELPGNLTSLTPPEATRTIRINITQPLLKETGQLRWSFNNIAHMENPTCEAVLDELYDVGPTGWAEKRAAATQAGNGIQAYNEQQGNYTKVAVYIEGQQKFIDTPRAAHHILELQPGEVVDFVVQNLDANANSGDYRDTSDARNRTAMEEHPLHLHGHKFWVMGAGPGMWNESAMDTYNTENPVYRDTYTLFKGGWTVIRFIADNPGAWAFHCHIAWHHFMGQRLVISEAMDGVSPRPPGFPECPNPCTFSNAPWRKSFVMSVWGGTGYATP